ncbi:hypothetical protein [Paraclostridium dentum]|uniref:hypothetical protein n=1 Tax=Paraclostridium dentum TaxID=2662455 RepID=UPI003F3EB096
MVYIPSHTDTENKVVNLLDGKNSNEAALEIQYYDKDNTRISTKGYALPYTTKNSWTKVVIEDHTAPANTVKANARIYLRRNGKF